METMKNPIVWKKRKIVVKSSEKSKLKGRNNWALTSGLAPPIKMEI